jgi:hypothetical protein|tara:strand:+ start:1101 stop:1370 length:270 start_codon:yes stop_codon:yes gene_type:complete
LNCSYKADLIFKRQKLNNEAIYNQEALIESADNNLYEANHRGKNHFFPVSQLIQEVEYHLKTVSSFTRCGIQGGHTSRRKRLSQCRQRP